jgi:hypothetical protein
MKEYVAELVRACPTPVHGRNVAREYLQARILGCLQRAGAMIPLAFQGGTALRFLYASPRHSEDLDFALERDRTSASSVEPLQYDLRTYLRAIRGELAAEGYAVELKVSDRRVVHSAFVRFAGLLYELGLSPHRDEVRCWPANCTPSCSGPTSRGGTSTTCCGISATPTGPRLI